VEGDEAARISRDTRERGSDLGRFSLAPHRLRCRSSLIFREAAAPVPRKSRGCVRVLRTTATSSDGNLTFEERYAEFVEGAPDQVAVVIVTTAADQDSHSISDAANRHGHVLATIYRPILLKLARSRRCPNVTNASACASRPNATFTCPEAGQNATESASAKVDRLGYSTRRAACKK